MSPFDRAHDFLSKFHKTVDLSRTASEIGDDFSRKSQNFPTSLYVAPLGIGYRRWGSKTRLIGLPGRQRRLTMSSKPSGYNAPTGHSIQTDGQTDTGRQQRPRLRTASGGKNDVVLWPHFYIISNQYCLLLF